MKMDWGLLDSNAVENKLLREEIVYGYKVGVGVVDGGGGSIWTGAYSTRTQSKTNC